MDSATHSQVLVMLSVKPLTKIVTDNVVPAIKRMWRRRQVRPESDWAASELDKAGTLALLTQSNKSKLVSVLLFSNFRFPWRTSRKISSSMTTWIEYDIIFVNSSLIYPCSSLYADSVRLFLTIAFAGFADFFEVPFFVKFCVSLLKPYSNTIQLGSFFSFSAAS